MRWINELHLDYPFAGSGMLRDLLRGDRPRVGCHDDAADGDRGDLPQAKHVEGGAGAQNLPLSTTLAGD